MPRVKGIPSWLRNVARRQNIELPAKPKRRPWSTRTEYGGRVYASKSQALRASQLDLLKAGGEILGWYSEPTVTLGCPENVYRPDFLVIGKDGAHWYEEVKGVSTEKYRHNVKLWKVYGRRPLIVLRPLSGGGWAEKTVPGGAQ